jgi:two-component system phosphate regulon sensor histidine kinase PhoR
MALVETGVIAALVFLFYRNAKKTRGLASDREEAETTLGARTKAAEEDRKRIVSILESMVEGVMVVDTGQRIIMLNSALSRAFGFKKEDAEGRFFWEIFRDRGINEMIEACFRQKSAVKREYELLLSGMIFEIQLSPIAAQSDFLGVVAVFHDLTPIKKLERMRTEFVANVSHELKTPLTSIMGFIETLKEGAIDDPKNRLKFLQIIDEHSRKLHQLIESLLLLSEIESGRQELRKEAVDLEPILRRLVEGFKLATAAKKIKVDMKLEPRPFILWAEPKSLEQALSNLIHNAVKYNREGGEIEIRALQDDRYSQIFIQDTGIGISGEDLPRIFERFYRADKSRSTDGSGLGLAIVKHIVERHAGRIEADSAVQKGSRFAIFLPRT